MKIKTKIGLKNMIRVILSLATIMILPGCEKVINVDLNEAAPHIVIEGLITDRRGPYTITISKSGSYFNQPVLQPVSGAWVKITYGRNATDSLRETSSGVYSTSSIRGAPGTTYTLKVISEGQEYDGSSTMLSFVNIDSLSLVKGQLPIFDFGGDNRNRLNMEIHCFFRDPIEKNYYRIKVFKNDSINTQNYRLYDDQYANGSETELTVANASAAGTYRIELLSIDEKTYEYYRALEDLLNTNPFFGSTPANPNNNLSNGALGYFGACAVSSKTIIITDSLIKSLK
jgi:hypothetical protein